MTTIDKIKIIAKEEINDELLVKSSTKYKTYKTVDEQIKYLKSHKKILISDEQANAFRERGYSSIINPYKEFFSYGRDEKNCHIYNDVTQFSEIIALISIDDRLCQILYSLIGVFEKKFKRVLFNEICLKYANHNEDLPCISYINEIEKYQSSFSDEDLPRFCRNIKYRIKKGEGYVEDLYAYEKRLPILNKLRELGTGFKADGQSSEEKKNKLIAHYLKKQPIVPLWIIPNGLSLGEFNLLFLILDKESQINIIGAFYDLNIKKIDTNKILAFSGLLEMIRKMRNIINHYEPLYPLIYNETKDFKKIEESSIKHSFDLLISTYEDSVFPKKIADKLDVKENNFNSKHLRTLKLIDELIKRK
ncbi:MAG: Abi family protein [Erysipelotrichaceae bacterium]